MMWVERCDSWGPANTVCPGFLLNVLKMDSGLSKRKKKKTELCHAFLRWGRVEPLCQRLPRQNDVSELWPHTVHHVKVTHIAAWRGLMSIQRERPCCNLTRKTQFGVDYYRTALGLWAPVSRISQCDVLSCPTFFFFFFFFFKRLSL